MCSLQNFSTMDGKCTICEQPLDNLCDSLIQVKETGLKSFIAVSKDLKDGKFNLWAEKSNITIHSKCKVWYLLKQMTPPNKKMKLHNQSLSQEINPNSYTDFNHFNDEMDVLNDEINPDSSTNKDEEFLFEVDFDFSNSCVLCGKKYNNRKKGNEISWFSNMIDKDELCKRIVCNESEEISKSIIQRIEIAQRLADNTFSYHKACFKRISMVRQL